uniref:Uncharacterized protein n=1 Tax=Polysiphonia sp. TaxID=1967842 RepID=A0A1Z1M3E6_9FLOR|nr:hypothetical protein [Polysiphonia sp.]
MKKNIDLFSKCIEGSWILQEDLYFSYNKKQKKYKKRINFLVKLINTKLVKTSKHGRITSVNFFIDKIKSINNEELLVNLYCSDKNKQSLFKLKKIRKNLFVITNLNNNENLSSIEYVHIINDNIMISLNKIKSTKNNQYFGLKICSYIKLVK